MDKPNKLSTQQSSRLIHDLAYRHVCGKVYDKGRAINPYTGEIVDEFLGRFHNWEQA